MTLWGANQLLRTRSSFPLLGDVIPTKRKMSQTPTESKSRFVIFAVATGLISLLFSTPLKHLAALSLSSDLYSHVLLIPIVSLYLAWDTNRIKRIARSEPQRIIAVVPFSVGLIALFTFLKTSANPSNGEEIENYLAYSILAYSCFVISAAFVSFGRTAVRTQLFPILFLLLVTPLPVPVREVIQAFFQHTSAEVSYWFISLAGIPIQRDGLIFYMPTIVMEVAPQCSGLRSSLVLFIVSTIAAFLFLRTPWKRALFVSLFVPIGILRNGIRILVLAWQCFHIDPEMINGWFHKHGGQPLFAVTLIPVFIVLWLFRRSEKRGKGDS